ncbi:MAG: hypothetical protein AAB467_04320, partial [Patescibacteria group bacterium]
PVQLEPVAVRAAGTSTHPQISEHLLFREVVVREGDASRVDSLDELPTEETGRNAPAIFDHPERLELFRQILVRGLAKRDWNARNEAVLGESICERPILEVLEVLHAWPEGRNRELQIRARLRGVMARVGTLALRDRTLAATVDESPRIRLRLPGLLHEPDQRLLVAERREVPEHERGEHLAKPWLKRLGHENALHLLLGRIE